MWGRAPEQTGASPSVPTAMHSPSRVPAPQPPWGRLQELGRTVLPGQKDPRLRAGVPAPVCRR